MTFLASTVTAFEAKPLPDALRKQAVSWLVGAARKRLSRTSAGFEQSFADAMANRPIAEHADAANAQHDEVPSAFFEQVLGPRLKYSCCLYDEGVTSLAVAEIRALGEPARTRTLKDGQVSPRTRLRLGIRCRSGWLSAAILTPSSPRCRTRRPSAPTSWPRPRRAA